MIVSKDKANERFIPLELFTGGEIRNDTEIRYTPADILKWANNKLVFDFLKTYFKYL